MPARPAVLLDGQPVAVAAGAQAPSIPPRCASGLRSKGSKSRTAAEFQRTSSSSTAWPRETKRPGNTVKPLTVVTVRQSEAATADQRATTLAKPDASSSVVIAVLPSDFISSGIPIIAVTTTMAMKKLAVSSTPTTGRR